MFSFLKKKASPSSLNKNLCCICREALSGKIIQDLWKNAAHFAHGVSFCGSCDRILSCYASGGAYQYSDGRYICGLCKKVAILDDITANKSRRKVLELLEKVGFQGIPKNIKIVITHQHHLSSHSRQRGTAGLTLTQFHFSNHKRVGATHQIGILNGLPKIEFEAILAHELLHVWQHEQHIKLSTLYAEGLCELGAFAIYSSEKSDFAKHKIQKMLNSKDPVYGNGFKLFYKKLEKMGWKKLIDEIFQNKNGYERSILKNIFGN